MTTKFQQKYRITSARLPNWNYGSQASYFITICTKNRDHFFGEIENGKIVLTDVGIIAEQFWREIPNHFPHIELGNFVVMPNHTHGILIITGNDLKRGDGVLDDGVDDAVDDVVMDDVVMDDVVDCRGVAMQRLYNPPRHPYPGQKNDKMSSISPKPGTISTIIRSYKSVVTKHAKQFDAKFAWQPRFHDHIIRNQISFENIQKYILNNPFKWKEDRQH